MIHGHADLNIYKRSYKAAVEMYKIANTLPIEERFGMISQLKRAATSIPLNIAEGYGKHDSGAEFKRYLRMALGSCNEMMVLISFCRDLEFIDIVTCQAYHDEYEEIARMINSMISKWSDVKN